jgi:hypothetical protein
MDSGLQHVRARNVLVVGLDIPQAIVPIARDGHFCRRYNMVVLEDLVMGGFRDPQVRPTWLRNTRALGRCYYDPSIFWWRMVIIPLFKDFSEYLEDMHTSTRAQSITRIQHNITPPPTSQPLQANVEDGYRQFWVIYQQPVQRHALQIQHSGQYNPPPAPHQPPVKVGNDSRHSRSPYQ